MYNLWLSEQLKKPFLVSTNNLVNNHFVNQKSDEAGFMILRSQLVPLPAQVKQVLRKTLPFGDILACALCPNAPIIAIYFMKKIKLNT